MFASLPSPPSSKNTGFGLDWIGNMSEENDVFGAEGARAPFLLCQRLSVAGDACPCRACSACMPLFVVIRSSGLGEDTMGLVSWGEFAAKVQRLVDVSVP